MAEAISTRAQRKRGNGRTGKSPFIVPTDGEIKVGNRLRGIRSDEVCPSALSQRSVG